MAVSLDAHQAGLSAELQKPEMYCLYICVCCIYCGKSCCVVQNLSTRGHKSQRKTQDTQPSSLWKGRISKS